jgi:dihydroorotate dehydrogenase (NAD+) catalytic subunit
MLMLNNLALSSGKHDLVLAPPIMNSAGILGFAPDPKLPFDFTPLGAFVTHPLSLGRRMPARPTWIENYPGGVLLHTGLPNPGLRGGIKAYRNSWGSFQRPVIAHVIADSPQDIAVIVEYLDEVDHPIQALEIGLEQALPNDALAMITIARQSQLPLLARLSLGTARDVAYAAIEAGVQAIVIGPPRGHLPGKALVLSSGRLYGPGLFPQALHELTIYLENIHIPVILGCGLFSAEHVRLAFASGAAGVQLDTILWVDPGTILQEIQALMRSEAQGDSSVQ